jgi:hypothetical protein
MRLRPDHDRDRVLLPSSPADRRPERPLPYAIALGILGGIDFILMYRMAETPIEFLILLFLLACTFVLAVETLSRIE